MHLILAILGIHFLDKLVYFCVVPNMPFLLHSHGLIDKGDIAIFFLVHLFLYRIMALYGGHVCDTRNIKLPLVLGAITEVAGIALISQKPDPSMLFASAVIIGVGGGLFNSAIYSIISSNVEHLPTRQKFLSVHFLILNAGALFGSWLLWEYARWSVTGLLFLLIVAIALVSFKVRQHNSNQKDELPPRFFNTLKTQIFHGELIRVASLAACVWCCYTMIYLCIPVISIESGIKWQGNIWLTINAAANVAAFAAFKDGKLNFITDSLQSSAGVMLMGLSMFMLAFTSNAVLIGASVVILGIGEMLAVPVLYGIAARIAPAHMTNRYIAIISVSAAVGEGLGHFLFIVVQDPTHICLLLGVVACVSAVLLRPRSQAHIQETLI